MQRVHSILISDWEELGTLTMHRTTGFCVVILATATMGCSASSLSIPEACANYVRAYAEDADLDPAGQAVQRALSDDSVDALKSSLDDVLADASSRYPGIASALSSPTEQARLIEEFGSGAADAMREIGLRFVALDRAIREKCSAYAPESN